LIAEGIETQGELETVRQLGCKYGQGYYLGRGAPVCRVPKRK
jgi:EAL domain-containing protein (putative c-di-GMP-specific phosphodiesterase class I)